MARVVSRQRLIVIVALLTLIQLVAVPLAFKGTTSAAHAAGPVSVSFEADSLRDVPGPGSGAAVTHDPAAVKGATIAEAFKWIVTADDIGSSDLSTATKKLCIPPQGTDSLGLGANTTYNPGDGQVQGLGCQWPSVRYTPGNVAVVAEGDTANGQTTASLDPGKYLVSTTAEGYEIGGVHFTVNADGTVTGAAISGMPAVTGAGLVHSFMQPDPVPLGTLRLRVFKDTAPVDGTYEVGVEQPLPGFHIHLNDVLAEVSTDWYGNKLCTVYQHTAKITSGANFTDTALIFAAHPEYLGNVANIPAQDWVGGYEDNWDPTSPVKFDPSTGKPLIDTDYPGGICTSDRNGDVVVPHIGSDRYTATVISPTGQSWYQTTTLEGNHDWDMWIADGETGYDTEQTVGGEPVPPVDMGFVPFGARNTESVRTCTRGGGGRIVCRTRTQLVADAGPLALAGTNTVNGNVVELNTYVGGTGGLTVPAAGVANANVRGPVANPIITLSDLGNNDQMVYVGRGDSTGKFSIPNVPAGSYQVTEWDYNQDMIIDSFNVDVAGTNQTVNIGQHGLVDWYTQIKGTIFVDTNGNGKQDPGEPGIPKFTVALKERDNSLLDAGQNVTTTDEQGHYTIREAYPLSRFLVLEAFNTRYRTTGITVQADNEPTPTTYLGGAVDVNVQAVIGLSGKVDWGVKPYTGTENGGIVGTVTYDTTRNELDARYSVTEAYQPGIPGLTMHLYAPIDCTTGAAAPTYAGANPTCGTDGYWHYADDATSSPENSGNGAAPGAIVPLSDATGAPIDMYSTYQTETWHQPAGCTARQYDGSPLDYSKQLALPPAADDGKLCVEAPMLGWYAKPSEHDSTSFSTEVNGNYGFGTVDHDPSTGAPLPAATPIPNGDYIVKVDIPKLANGQPLYQVTKEQDVNIFSGDSYTPQEGSDQPIAISGSTNTGVGGNGGATSNQPGGQFFPCVGADQTVHVTNQAFLAGGGSPFEGQRMPLCDEKLITVRGAQSVAPNFNLFTPVPLPTHYWGLTINDLGLSQDKTQAGYGEAQPLPGVPMGIYDWAGNLVDTTNTDYNGMYEVTEPSTSSYNCPLPAGPCPGMFYFKGNDPGQPGHANPNYNPRFRTIGTEFQAWPGLFTATDTAPSQVANVAVAPGATNATPVLCEVSTGTPNLMSVSTPIGSGTVTPGASDTVTRVQIIRNPSTGARTATLTLGSALPAGFVVGANPTVNVGGLVGFTPGLNGAHVLTAVNASLRTISYAMPGGFITFNSTATGTVTLPDVVTGGTTALTINGNGFGTAPVVTFTNAANVATSIGTTTASDTAITLNVPVAGAGALAPGRYQISIKNAQTSKTSVNGLTFHVLGNGYNPQVFRVNAPAGLKGDATHEFDTSPSFVYNSNIEAGVEHVLQNAVNAASGVANGNAIVAVWPNLITTNNPTGDYFENLIVNAPITIQGTGPGGFNGVTTTGHADGYVPGARINGLGFNADNQVGTDWVAAVAATNHDGPADVPDAAVITILGNGNRFASATNKPAIDGLTVTGGSQADNPTNTNVAGGGAYGGNTTGGTATGALVTQGGGIYLHSSADNLQITNDIIIGNGGSYAGGIRIGTPYDSTIHDNNVVISHNRIRDNGGTNLAGGVGLFDGTNSYQITNNDLCGNFSSEYGGGISHYGRSSTGNGAAPALIANNRIWFNQSYDEGGGVFIAGELNSNLNAPSTGSGPVNIDANVIQDNQANDDGGGIRFLSAGNYEINVTNNMVSDNISTHEGGGFALDDSTNVHIVGDTVINNITTATAVTSNGQPAPAGLSTAANSVQLQATLPLGSSAYSKPELKDDIFWNNRAGTYNAATMQVTGIGAIGDATPINVWNVGAVDPISTDHMVVSNSDLNPLSATEATQVNTNGTDRFGDPLVVRPYTVAVQVLASRTFPGFRESVIVAENVPIDLQGDYHLTSLSPAAHIGNWNAITLSTTQALLNKDIDGQTRSHTTGSSNAMNAGADEFVFGTNNAAVTGARLLGGAAAAPARPVPVAPSPLAPKPASLSPGVTSKTPGLGVLPRLGTTGGTK